MGDLPISDEARKAAAAAITTVDGADTVQETLERCAESAIRAFLDTEHFSIQRRKLYSGQTPIGKGRRFVSAWKPIPEQGRDTPSTTQT